MVKNILLNINQVILSFYARSRNLKRKYKSINSLEEFLKNQKIHHIKNSQSIDLGCGNCPKNPFLADKVIGIDNREELNEGIIKSNLITDLIPFKNESFEYCSAFNFIEHIPRIDVQNGKSKFPLIEIMNEIYRILKPRGFFLHVTPAYPSKEAFQDPTHVNFITEDTFPNYFCRQNKLIIKQNEEHFPAKNYGFKGDFILIDQVWLNNAWILCLMQAIK